MYGAGQAATFVHGLYRKPSLGARIMGTLLLIVIGIPLLLLMLFMALVSLTVFFVLGIWAALTGKVAAGRSTAPPPKPGHDDEGRQNVRVRR